MSAAGRGMTWCAAAWALAATCGGCVSTYVGSPSGIDHRGSAAGQVRSPKVLAFHCAGGAAFDCDKLEMAADHMVAEAFARAASDTDASASAHELLEITIDDRGDPLPQPLRFARGMAWFVLLLSSPITLSSEDTWALEVSVTSADAPATTYRYENAVYQTGGLFTPISLPPPPASAERVPSHARDPFPARSRVLRSLLARFIADVAPDVCAANAASVGENSPEDREALRLACGVR
jgi:hypothetical protein